MRCHSEDQLAPTLAPSYFNSRTKITMDKNGSVWSKIAVRTMMNVATHPLEYAKILIQIGYEPIEPRPTTTLFGKPALGLPNIFQYVRYIKSVDGFTGCYRGLAPKLVANTLFDIAVDKSIKDLEFDDEPDDNTSFEDLEDDEKDKKYVYDFIKNFVGRTIGIIISHPFDVIAVRTMAQFVGRETKYDTLFGSIVAIYKDEGVGGFFVGLTPRLIANAVSLILSYSVLYAINKYFVQGKELRTLTSTTMAFLAATITYPYSVVSQCMIVNNCGLIAGQPPFMPIYPHWTDCWRHLSYHRQLKRGNSLLWRYYTGPQIFRDGQMHVDTSEFLKKVD